MKETSPQSGRCEIPWLRPRCSRHGTQRACSRKLCSPSAWQEGSWWYWYYALKTTARDHWASKFTPSFDSLSPLDLGIFPKQMASASTSIHMSLSNFLYQDIGTWKSPLNECWDHWDWGGGRILSPERVLRAGLDYSLAIQSDFMLLVCFRVTFALPSGHQKR